MLNPSAAAAQSDLDLSKIPFDVLKAELNRRDEDWDRPSCGSGPRGSYNTSLHVFALFLILVLSTLACSFPVVARRYPRLPIPHRFLFLSRHFGTGVLIATAFVHLLPTAFVSLTDPCLPSFWNEGYPAMPGLVAMLSVFVVVGIEMFFASKGAAHAHGDYAMVDKEHTGQGHPTFGDEEDEAPLVLHGAAWRKSSGRPGKSGGLKHFKHDSFTSAGDGMDDRKGPSSAPIDERPRSQDTVRHHRRSSEGYSESDLELDDFTEDADPLRPEANGTAAKAQAGGDAAAQPLPDDREEQRLILQCLLLEAGILFHSVFIGMALSVATGTPFVVLLIAISFHQTFEGLALGSRIAAIRSFHTGKASIKPWLMALAYGATTPIGQAIGLGVHNLYDPASEAGLLTVGFMNAISSGLLLFAGLVELLAEDFLSEKSYVALKGRARLQACASVVLGALLMAGVGAFA